MVEFIFNCLVCALGVYFAKPISLLLEFTLRAELKIAPASHRYLSGVCFVITPALCLYSTFVGDSVLLPCFVALAGYLIREQDSLIHETALIIGELEDEKSTHIAEMQEALEEQAETLISQNERLKELRYEINEAKLKEAKLKEASQSCMLCVLERELFDINRPWNKNHRKGTEVKTYLRPPSKRLK